MSDTSCKICFKTFNDCDTVPKSLECGHTVCSICLTKLLHSSKACPECREPMTKKTPEEFPTNYAFMSLVEKCKKDIEVQFVDTNFMLARKAEMIEAIDECITLFVSVTDDLAQIPNQFLSDCQEIESNKMLLRAEANLQKAMDNLILFRKENYKLLSIKKFRSQKEFLEKIWSLLDEGKPVFGKGTIEGVEKCTKLRKERVGIRGIEIPSLTLPQVEDKEATIVKFSDLKLCVRADKLLLFLEGDNERWRHYYGAVEGPLLPFYTALFTGEMGATFKGVKVGDGRGDVYYSVPHYLRDGVPSSGPIGSFSHSKEERDVKRDQELFGGFRTLTGDWKGAMEDVKWGGRPSSRFFHVIGKWKGGISFFYTWDSRDSISDCGIVLRL